MNCKPGDIARIVGVHPSLAMVRDRIVRITQELPTTHNGEPLWRLTERVHFVLVGSGRAQGQQFWIGESVWFDQLQDRFLRPICDPGADAQDETLSWVPVPNSETEPA